MSPTICLVEPLSAHLPLKAPGAFLKAVLLGYEFVLKGFSGPSYRSSLCSYSNAPGKCPFFINWAAEHHTSYLHFTKWLPVTLMISGILVEGQMSRDRSYMTPLAVCVLHLSVVVCRCISAMYFYCCFFFECQLVVHFPLNESVLRCCTCCTETHFLLLCGPRGGETLTVAKCKTEVKWGNGNQSVKESKSSLWSTICTWLACSHIWSSGQGQAGIVGSFDTSLVSCGPKTQGLEAPGHRSAIIHCGWLTLCFQAIFWVCPALLSIATWQAGRLSFMVPLDAPTSR